MSKANIQNGASANTLKRRSSETKLRRLASASGPALMMALAASAAHAQETGQNNVETVVVTSTRILSGAQNTPTPTQVVSAADIANNAEPNVFTTLVQMPDLMGSTGTAVGTGGSSNNSDGLSTLNIRGLGTTRNLVLLDGQRVVPSAITGFEDISLFPQMLIQRVDVVTGGASASWGSDAVSGVVNFVLDKDFSGFKANIQGGLTSYGDDGEGLIQMAAGTDFDNGRGHIEISAEGYSHAGVNSLIGARTWYDRQPSSLNYSPTTTPLANFSGICTAATSGQCAPEQNKEFNAQPYGFTVGGIITNGALQGTAFGAGGQPYAFQYGYGVNGLQGVPSHGSGNIAAVTNCTGSFCIGGDTSAQEIGYQSLDDRLERGSFYGRVSYNLTPNMDVYATAAWGEVFTAGEPTQNFYNAVATIYIGCDNAFLPTLIAQNCSANAAIPGNAYAPTAAFPNGAMGYGAQNSKSVLTSVEVTNNRTMRRFTLGTDGVFNLLGTDWTYQAYAEHGENDTFNTNLNAIIRPYYTAAIDAVEVTSANAASFPGIATGTIVCASAAARATGCQPLDIIGTTGVSPAAKAYVQGTGNRGTIAQYPWADISQRQDVLDYSMSGEPFEDWAGKISVAAGYEYREEAFEATSDCVSQASATPCANQSVGDVTFGAAGDPLLSNIGGNWYAGNFQPGHGNFHENEVFLETLVPLLKNDDWGTVNADIAGRETDYSTSGYISTWKVGFTWDTPLDGLRLRALQSRDVRAPNLAELFAGARVNNGSVTDDFAPHAGVTYNVQNPISANPNLKPEKGLTDELGLVYQPDWAPGFNSAITFYRVGVKGLVSVLSQQQEMDLCYQGNQLQCSFITFDNGTTSGIPTYQITPNINLASVVTSGVDYQAAYRFAVDDVLNWGLGGDMTFNITATNVMSYISNSGLPGAIPSETAGANSGNTPHWKLLFTQNYETDKWSIFVVEHWFSNGYNNDTAIVCQTNCPLPTTNYPTTNFNAMPGDFWYDLGGAYNIGTTWQVYAKVDDVNNSHPSQAALLAETGNSQQGYSVNAALYPVLGRYYHIGVRIND